MTTCFQKALIVMFSRLPHVLLIESDLSFYLSAKLAICFSFQASDCRGQIISPLVQELMELRLKQLAVVTGRGNVAVD